MFFTFSKPPNPDHVINFLTRSTGSAHESRSKDDMDWLQDLHFVLVIWLYCRLGFSVCVSLLSSTLWVGHSNMWPRACGGWRKLASRALVLYWGRIHDLILLLLLLLLCELLLLLRWWSDQTWLFTFVFVWRFSTYVRSWVHRSGQWHSFLQILHKS
jgi:hypothetical protein